MSLASNENLPASASQGGKRAREQGSRGSTKTKRARYVAVACDGCKRRKIRCDGQMPCARCDDLDAACSYDTDNRELSRDLQVSKELRTHLQNIDNRLDKLTHHIVTLQNGGCALYTIDEDVSPRTHPTDVSHRRARSSGVLDQPQSLCPGFRGPTSSSFIFEVANDTLRNKGLRSEPASSAAEAGSETCPYRHQGCGRPCLQDRAHDILLRAGESVVQSLCDAYDSSINILYPVLDMPRILRRIRLLFSPTGPTSNVEIGTGSSETDKDDVKFEIDIVKLICAASLASGDHAQHAKAQTLYSDVDTECPVWDAMGLKGLQYLIVVAIYHVQMGQDVRASRIIGVAGRLCLEMGLNRREVLERTYPEQHARDSATRIFWSIYLLDMRASCGTGIPFVIQEIDIDPTLPEPDSPCIFLKTMVSFARLSGKVWRVENSFTTPESKLTVDNIELLDYQAIQWQKKMPESLRYNSSEPESVGASKKEPLFARVMAQVRLNQLRSLIHRRVLYSSSRITQHTLYAQTVVDIAKNTIALLTELNHTAALYQAHPVIFNHFVISALGVFLLAVANAPEHFAEQCSSGYYAALGLLKQSATQSEVVSRLWKTVESLESLGPLLGVTRPSTPVQPPKAGLADTRTQHYSPRRGPLMDHSQFATPQFQSSDYRDDLANLFNFPLDSIDYSLFLSQDPNADSGTEGQLGNMFDGMTYGSIGGVG